MVRLYRRRFLYNIFQLTVLVILLVAEFFIVRHHCQQSSRQTSLQEQNPRFYFETNEGYQLRLRVQEKVKFGSQMKKLAEEYFNKREGYNESFVDSIPIVRPDSPDFRPPPCKNITYPRSETKISVVLNFHNELLSLVLRSVYSVLIAIPAHNFHEIILIDDGSNLTQFFDLLEIKPITDSFSVSVKYFRFQENKGLVYSRRFGCKSASGDVVLVLDSHVEINPGFIEPLLSITDKSYNTIASPIIQFWNNLGENKIWYNADLYLGFDPYLTWIFSPAPAGYKPYPAAAIFGGAYLATKRFLEEVDYFGRGMEGWGYEHLEISLKAWMCGEGTMYVPCSQVLHYNAKRSPMKHGDRKRANHLLHNAGLVVKSYFSDNAFQDFNLHVHLGKDLDNNSDDIRANKEVLTRNRCPRDYQWIRRHLMPDIESFDHETLIAHTLMIGGQCVQVSKGNDTFTAQLTDCSEPKSTRNSLRLTIWGEMRIFDRLCLDWGYPGLHFVHCHRDKGNQITIYGTEDNHIKSNYGDCLVVFDDAKALGKGSCQPSDQLNNYTVPRFTFGVVF